MIKVKLQDLAWVPCIIIIKAFGDQWNRLEFLMQCERSFKDKCYFLFTALPTKKASKKFRACSSWSILTERTVPICNLFDICLMTEIFLIRMSVFSPCQSQSWPVEMPMNCMRHKHLLKSTLQLSHKAIIGYSCMYTTGWLPNNLHCVGMVGRIFINHATLNIHHCIQH